MLLSEILHKLVCYLVETPIDRVGTIGKLEQHDAKRSTLLSIRRSGLGSFANEWLDHRVCCAAQLRKDVQFAKQ